MSAGLADLFKDLMPRLQKGVASPSMHRPGRAAKDPMMQRAFDSMLYGQASNSDLNRDPTVPVRAIRRLYNGNPGILDASQLSAISPLMGRRMIFSGHGSGV